MKKTITVIQPWAALLVNGKKRCETRSWKTNYRGEILIHAGKKNPLDGIFMMEDGVWEDALLALGLNGDFDLHKELPTGAIIGKTNLVNCVRIDEGISQLIKEQHPDEYRFGDFTPGRYAWVMEDPVVFDQPVQVSGKQGLWNWEGELPK